MNDNDINSIDKKIHESSQDNIKGIRDYLKHSAISSEDMREEIKDMTNNFSKKELEKVLKVVLDIEEKNTDIQ